MDRLREGGLMATRGATNVFHELDRDPNWRPTRDDFEALGHLLHNIAGTLGHRAERETVGEWQLVPVKPTDEMLACGEGITDFILPSETHDNSKEGRMAEMRTAWLEMLAAAPKPAADTTDMPGNSDVEVKVREARISGLREAAMIAQTYGVPGGYVADTARGVAKAINRRIAIQAGQWGYATAKQIALLQSIADNPQTLNDVRQAITAVMKSLGHGNTVLENTTVVTIDPETLQDALNDGLVSMTGSTVTFEADHRDSAETVFRHLSGTTSEEVTA